MKILETLKSYCNSDHTAMINQDKKISYKELWYESDKLAKYIKFNLKDDKTPVIVYGHKKPCMLVAFLACVKTGEYSI